MKMCNLCKTEKTLDHFYKLSKSRSYGDGYDTRCKECVKELANLPENKKKAKLRDKERAQSLKRLASQKKYRMSEKGKLSHKRQYKKYRQTEHGHVKTLEQGKIFRQTEKFKQAIIRHRQKFPDKRKAQYILANAVASGKVIRPFICAICDVPCTPEGHHSDYSQPLSVIWMCKKCHSDLHHSGIPL
jgi:hypothetical protein